VLILITTGIFPPDIGGPATYVPQIARGLSERGHAVKVLTTSEPKDLSNDDARYPFSVFRMNRRTPLWYRPLFYAQQILRHGQEVDVIYANGLFLETALANLWLRKPLVIKVVGDEAWERATHRGWSHDGFEDFQWRRQPMLGKLLKQLRSWVMRRTDKVIVPSRYLKRFVVGWGVPEKKCPVIYNAVDQNETELTISPRGAISLPETFDAKVRLITAGRLVPWKDVDLIIRLLSNLPDAVLTVVGDGPCRQQLEALSKSQRVSERVWFVGAVSKAVLRSLFQKHDIFVLASSYEGLPHIILEAMQAGLAVVATAVGGTPEVLQNGKDGVLVEPKDDSLAKALKQLIENRTSRVDLSSHARSTVKKFFSSDGMIEQTESVLLSLVSDREQ
jgi:glycosyltransferase involved in cell wall biosynthesis